MKKRLIIISSSFFILFGALLLSNSFSSITGFVVFEEIGKTTGSLFGIIFVLTGIVLLLTHRTEMLGIENVVRNYEHGKINPAVAAKQIRDGLRSRGIEINGVRYKGHNHLQIRTEREFIPVALSNDKKASDLAFGIYEMAILNDRGNDRYCEIHGGKGVSTKHYRKGFKDAVSAFEDKYHGELVSAGA